MGWFSCVFPLLLCYQSLCKLPTSAESAVATPTCPLRSAACSNTGWLQIVQLSWLFVRAHARRKGALSRNDLLRLACWSVGVSTSPPSLPTLPLLQLGHGHILELTSGLMLGQSMGCLWLPDYSINHHLVSRTHGSLSASIRAGPCRNRWLLFCCFCIPSGCSEPSYWASGEMANDWFP